MKIRILHNSIRFRLSKTELTLLIKEGRVEDIVSFGPDQTLIYRLSVHRDILIVTPSYTSGLIEISIPASFMAKFETEDFTGIYSNYPNGQESHLAIKIEKDYKCLTPRDEDESDLFQNPASLHSC